MGARALALTASALPVRRETLETAAIVTRVAPSFLRFGHFEHFAHTAADTEEAPPAKMDIATLPLMRRRTPPPHEA